MDVEYLIWLSEQALWFILGIWPVTLPLVWFLIHCAVKTFRREKALFKKRQAVLLLPVLAIPVLLVFGTVYRDQPDYMDLLTRIMLVQIGVIALLILNMKGNRLFTLSICLLLFWCAAVCYFVAGMSVTGDWL